MPLPNTSSWLDLDLGGSLLLSSAFWAILQGLLKRALNMELRTGRRTLLWLWRTVWRFESGINQRSLRLSEMSSQWAKLPTCSRWKQWSRVSWMGPPNGQPKLLSLVSKLKLTETEGKARGGSISCMREQGVEEKESLTEKKRESYHPSLLSHLDPGARRSQYSQALWTVIQAYPNNLTLYTQLDFYKNGMGGKG